jgi:hypothetical protein
LPLLYFIPNLAKFILQRCNNPERGIKCVHVKFRKRGPKYLDDLHLLFEKVHVTGASASCPGDISSSDSSDEEPVEITPIEKPKPAGKKRKQLSSPTEEKEEKSPFFRMYKNTCMRIESAADKIGSSLEASSAPPQSSPVPTITQAMRMVKDCGIQEKTALMHTAHLLIMKPEFREIFGALETNEGRFDLIEREHEIKKAT